MMVFPGLYISRSTTGLLVCAQCGEICQDAIELGIRNGGRPCGEIRVCSENCAIRALEENRE